MDEESADEQSLSTALRFLAWTNRCFGSTWVVKRWLARESRGWPAGTPITVLDVATGLGDVPRELARWGEARGVELRTIGLDSHAGTLRHASTDPGGVGRGRLVQGDALALPFRDGSVDYVLSGNFLHHLTDQEATSSLLEMARIARRGVLVNDLLRSSSTYLAVTLITTLWGNAMAHHDGQVSVRRAFTVPELRRLLASAGLQGTVRAYPFRLVAHLSRT